MTQEELKKAKLPDNPGIYIFLDAKGNIMYIGKATSLRDRVRSYFANDLLHTRGKHIVDMVTLAKTVKHTMTDSALEALILEASLIKKHQPYYNTKEKDNKSFNYVVITDEEFPRVFSVRERTMLSGDKDVEKKYKYIFGPFPEGTNLAMALKLIRKIFPFRDTCIPNSGKPCFNRQIGLCPGVCDGAISAKGYGELIRNIALFFEGKKKAVLLRVEKAMHAHAKNHEFEEAHECKKTLFGLQHINDVSLLSEDVRKISRSSSRKRAKPYRIEAYDIAHISGKYTVGVMVVLEDGVPKKSDYRKFKIRIESERSDDPKAIRQSADATVQALSTINDVLHLEQVLRRRFGHKEWTHPDLLVIDGGTAQKRRAEKVMKELGISVDIVSVVKDERHKAKAILGNREVAESYKRGILIANAESHRFAVAYHRLLRDRIKSPKK